MDPLSVTSFLFAALLCVVPFIFVYFLAERLESYFRSRSYLFILGCVFSALSFSLLVTDSILNPSSISLGSGMHLSGINLAGTLFFLLAALSLYIMTGGVVEALGGQREDPLPALFVVAVLAALYYVFATMEVDEPLSMSLNFVFSILSFLFLILSFRDLSYIYASLASGYRLFSQVSSYLLLWHVFYQAFGFLEYVVSSGIDVTLFYEVQISLTLVILVLMAFPVFRMVRSLNTTVSNDISPFLSRISALIGGSALTILGMAMAEYNGKHRASIRYDPERGLIGADEDFLPFLASYFERYIGPVAGRIYSESVPQHGRDPAKTS
jgi:hypothetical protein